MKMKKQAFAFLLILAMTTSILFGCSTKGSGTAADNMGVRGTGEAYENETAPSEDGFGNMGPQTGAATGEDNGVIYDPNRKLIRTVDMSLETKQFDELQTNLSAKINEVGGYIENSSARGNSYHSSGSRSLQMTIRVPKDKLDIFVNDISGLGNVTQKSEQVQDVTLQYVDTASRKESLLIQQERLLEMLKKATKLEDMITLETRLSEVRYEIESIERQLRTYDSQVDYSTVNIQVYEVERITEKPAETLWERMSSGFSETLRDMGDGLASFAVWFVANIPYLIIWAVVIFVIVIIIKRIVKKQRAKTPKVIIDPTKPMGTVSEQFVEQPTNQEEKENK